MIMEETLNLNAIVVPSEDAVIREIEGEIIIIPISSGLANMEDELYSLNSTGKAIIKLLDGKRSLSQITIELLEKYEATPSEIEDDVLGIVSELLKRNLLIRLD